MHTTELLHIIITRLTHDLNVLYNAAKTAHAASTDEENQPDNKYDTLALEASYVAQGQANRAQELRKSIALYKQLKPHDANFETVRLTSLVTLEDADGSAKIVFIAPAEGGLKIEYQGQEIQIITPASPIGKELLGRSVGETIEIEAGCTRKEYEIVEVR